MQRKQQGPGNQKSCPKSDSITDHTTEAGAPGASLRDRKEGSQFGRLVGVLAMNTDSALPLRNDLTYFTYLTRLPYITFFGLLIYSAIGYL